MLTSRLTDPVARGLAASLTPTVFFFLMVVFVTAVVGAVDGTVGTAVVGGSVVTGATVGGAVVDSTGATVVGGAVVGGAVVTGAAVVGAGGTMNGGTSTVWAAAGYANPTVAAITSAPTAVWRRRRRRALVEGTETTSLSEIPSGTAEEVRDSD